MRRAAKRSRAPMRCATSVAVALASASGNMNSTDTRFAASWCPATGVAPRRTMKMAMNAKPVTSIRIDSPIGTPRRSCAPMAWRSGAPQPGTVQREGCVEAVAPQDPQPGAHLQPHGDGGGDAAALYAQLGNAQARHAEDQRCRQRQLQAQAGELDDHHRLRPRHRVVEAAVGGEQQRRRQREGQRQQVLAHLGLDLGRGLRQRQEGPREGQQRAADERTGPVPPRPPGAAGGRPRAASSRRRTGRRSARPPPPRP